jgi:anthranilate phosphoribosyltransferase
MRHVGPTRVELGTRTIFNLLGPLSNPAGTRRQIVGVFAADWITPLAQVLGKLGSERAWVMHGSDGLDELTTTGPSQVAEYFEGRVHSFEVTPEQVGLKRARPEDLRGGDAATNARALRAVLDGASGPYRDIVLLNSAAALLVAGKVDRLQDGVRLAAEVIDNAHARHVLERLIEITNQVAAA